MPLVISVAGSDPGRGAGLQMDARVCWRLGVQFRGVVAVYTVQDDDGLKSVTPRPAEQVAADLRASLAVVEELNHWSAASAPGLAIKTGALGDEGIVQAVAEVLGEFNQHYGSGDGVPLVIDPVRAASKDLGAQLLSEAGWHSMKKLLFPMATIVTPNTLEFGNGNEYKNCRGVLLKGGHPSPDRTENQNSEALTGSRVRDQFWQQNNLVHEVVKSRIPGATSLHGTGCALSTALAAELARHGEVIHAIDASSNALHDWLAAAIQNGKPLLAS